MLEGDGGGAPEVSLEGQTRWYRTGTSGNWGRLRQKTGLLVLFGVRRQGYSTYEMRADGRPIWAILVKERVLVSRLGSRAGPCPLPESPRLLAYSSLGARASRGSASMAAGRSG